MLSQGQNSKNDSNFIHSYWPVCGYIVRLSRNVLQLACCSAAVIYGGGPLTTGLCGKDSWS